MKRFLSFLLMVGLIMLFPVITHAEGAITADEQRILDALNQGVTANGQTFYFSSTDIQQAENDLKTYDYEASTVNQIVGNINSARQLVIDNSAGMTASSLTDLLKQLPRDVQKQVGYYVAASAKALDVKVDQNGSVVTNNYYTNGETEKGSKGGAASGDAGRKVFVPTNAKNPVVKTTGGNYVMPFAVLGSLAIATFGLAIASSNKWSTINA
ncbi:hypothetical protein [Vagococcus sp.]|uniref:hypothetical protein n=1 Tax=Vagococcus sp. TaxID=1933889 RepID=UPI003F97082F